MTPFKKDKKSPKPKSLASEKITVEELGGGRRE